MIKAFFTITALAVLALISAPIFMNDNVIVTAQEQQQQGNIIIDNGKVIISSGDRTITVNGENGGPGSPGPQGPMGPAGPQGIQGPPGKSIDNATLAAVNELTSNLGTYQEILALYKSGNLTVNICVFDNVNGSGNNCPPSGDNNNNTNQTGPVIVNPPTDNSTTGNNTDVTPIPGPLNPGGGNNTDNNNDNVTDNNNGNNQTNGPLKPDVVTPPFQLGS